MAFYTDSQSSYIRYTRNTYQIEAYLIRHEVRALILHRGEVADMG